MSTKVSYDPDIFLSPSEFTEQLSLCSQDVAYAGFDREVIVAQLKSKDISGSFSTDMAYLVTAYLVRGTKINKINASCVKSMRFQTLCTKYSVKEALDPSNRRNCITLSRIAQSFPLLTCRLRLALDIPPLVTTVRLPKCLAWLGAASVCPDDKLSAFTEWAVAMDKCLNNTGSRHPDESKVRSFIEKARVGTKTYRQSLTAAINDMCSQGSL